MDANRYATKKSLAQGMLDIALLTANASQLRYTLQVGPKHEFYVMMLTMISVSIIMQVSIFRTSYLLLHYYITIVECGIVWKHQFSFVHF